MSSSKPSSDNNMTPVLYCNGAHLTPAEPAKQILAAMAADGGQLFTSRSF